MDGGRAVGWSVVSGEVSALLLLSFHFHFIQFSGFIYIINDVLKWSFIIGFGVLFGLFCIFIFFCLDRTCVEGIVLFFFWFFCWE